MSYMPKYRPNCKTCIRSKDNPKFRERVYKAKFRWESGDETLKDIAEEFNMNFNNVYNHARKHLASRDMKPETKQLRITKKTAEIKAAVQKKHELAIDHAEVINETEAVDALNEYITQGHSLIKEGKLAINAQSFLQAVRLSIDYESKKKDREVDIIKTMYRFAAGGKKQSEPSKDPSPEGRHLTAGTPTDTDPGTPGPGDLHPEAAGDAVTHWAARISQGDTETEDPYKLADLQQPVGEIDPN